MASDATKYSLKDRRPDWVSLVSVAVAVKDIKKFNSAYGKTVRQYMQDYDIRRRYPILKSDDIARWADDWVIEDVLRDMVEDLLRIETLDTIQITETSLHSRWVDVFSDDGNSQKTVRSEDFINKYLEPYYNIISVWEYLRKAGTRPRTHRKVLTDDFSGHISPAWLSVGSKAEELRIVPKGDETYALLSMADLLMEYIKQEVDTWGEKEIYEHLKERTHEKGGWIDSDAIDTDEELRMIAPHKHTHINTARYYPSPTIYIDSGSLKSKVVRSLDFYDYALAYARKFDGSVKFLNESQDRDYITSQDYVICLDGNCSDYHYLEDLNSVRVPEVIDMDGALSLFEDKLGAYGG